MKWSIVSGGPGTLRTRCSIEIDAAVPEVFGAWSRFEELPRWTAGLRHAKRIDARHILWDAEIFGHQVVWEAEIVELVPDKRIRWASCRGAPNAGEVTFEELPGGRTRVSVDVRYRPQGFLERTGARLGLLTLRIRRDLDRLRRVVEAAPSPEAPSRVAG
jgi:uncharacterized membrane protein